MLDSDPLLHSDQKRDDTASLERAITPEDAKLINERLYLRIVGAYHGNPERMITRPTTLEFNAVAGIIDELDPANGDVLYVEHLGLGGEPFPLGGLTDETDPEELAAAAAYYRSLNKIDAFTYGVLLAKAKGIPVVVADMTPEELQQYLSDSGYNLNYLLTTDGPEAEAFQLERERCMAKIMARGGRDALPYIADGTRPVHALLAGPGHMEEGHRYYLPRAFDRLELTVQVDILPNDNERRLAYMAMQDAIGGEY